VSDQAIILLAEDREDDVLLIRRAFQKADILNPIYVVGDGQEAIAYLAGEGKYANRAEYPLPDLLLLDLKMPRMDGFQVLTWIRQQPSFSTLRVVVLTSSEDFGDVNLAYKQGANSFLVKPLDFESFIETARIVREYWLVLDKSPEASWAKPEPEPQHSA